MIVSLEDVSEVDATDYLLSSPANRERLIASVTEMQEGTFQVRDTSY
jgi:PHD/YefM family antitoxin component YafN of YafNO toxin-antitoxin module